MMRPMKLGGDALVFGQGALDYLKTLKGKKACIVISGGSVERSGYLAVIEDALKEAGIETMVFKGVEPDPTFKTVMQGAEEMKKFCPDWILGVGGGSAMDAAKAMWVYYEHPELTTLEQITPPNPVPPLRAKARLICIPTTSGSASEVSRSVVITDTEKHLKVGIGHMEMMPDVALLDPGITASMPPSITAATGIDALTHAVEAYVSGRANELSDILAERAVAEICKYLPLAYAEGDNLLYREKMLLYSAVAGMAFTNVSLGIVHSIAHTVGGMYGIPHGLADGIVLPYVIEYNMSSKTAAKKYEILAGLVGATSFIQVVKDLNQKLGIPENLREVIKNDSDFDSRLREIAEISKRDGCTKTNPVLPEVEDLERLLVKIYYGKQAGE